ncbi:MAG: peptide ABC transporter substrate-binding protein [Chitinivibrionales bacterium]|nr:peptide ABC transporter substrate-binding protein [Chitinivibrionales bacterium]
MKKNSIDSAVGVLCAIGVIFFSATPTAKPSNDQLVIGTAQEFENLNPIVKQMAATTYPCDMVGRGLMTLNPDSKWVPVMAKEIPTFENKLAEFYTENGIKKIKATWEIKENVKWGDGKPVTGEDVVFSHMVGINENVSVPERDVYAQVERVEIDKTNPRKFTFYHKNARWDYFQKPTFHIIPKHLEGPVFEKYKTVPQGYEKNSLYTTNPTNPGLYNGPYLIEEIKLGSHISLKLNPLFYGTPAKIKKVIIKVIPQTATLEANLLAGTIDMINPNGIEFDQANILDEKVKKENLPYTVNLVTGCVYEHIDLQLSNPILADAKVRKALVHAIDRQKLVQSLFNGKQQAAVQDLSPIDPWYTNDPKKIVLYEYSPKKARELLKQAGWVLNEKERYCYKDGKKLTFQIMTTAQNKTRETVETFLQEEWKKIGVEITIKNEPPRVLFGETVRKSLFPDMVLFAWVSSPYNTPRSTLHKASIPSETNGFSGQNDTRWINEEATKYIEEMDTTFSEAKRVELRQKISYQYTNDVPVIPLYYRVQITVIPKSLTGYRLPGHLFGETNWIENWSLN